MAYPQHGRTGSSAQDGWHADRSGSGSGSGWPTQQQQSTSTNQGQGYTSRQGHESDYSSVQQRQGGSGSGTAYNATMGQGQGRAAPFFTGYAVAGDQGGRGTGSSEQHVYQGNGSGGSSSSNSYNVAPQGYQHVQNQQALYQMRDAQQARYDQGQGSYAQQGVSSSGKGGSGFGLQPYINTASSSSALQPYSPLPLTSAQTLGLGLISNPGPSLPPIQTSLVLRGLEALGQLAAGGQIQIASKEGVQRVQEALGQVGLPRGGVRVESIRGHGGGVGSRDSNEQGRGQSRGGDERERAYARDIGRGRRQSDHEQQEQYSSGRNSGARGSTSNNFAWAPLAQPASEQAASAPRPLPTQGPVTATSRGNATGGGSGGQAAASTGVAYPRPAQAVPVNGSSATIVVSPPSQPSAPARPPSATTPAAPSSAAAQPSPIPLEELVTASNRTKWEEIIKLLPLPPRLRDAAEKAGFTAGRNAVEVYVSMTLAMVGIIRQKGKDAALEEEKRFLVMLRALCTERGIIVPGSMPRSASDPAPAKAAAPLPRQGPSPKVQNSVAAPASNIAPSANNGTSASSTPSQPARIVPAPSQDVLAIIRKNAQIANDSAANSSATPPGSSSNRTNGTSGLHRLLPSQGTAGPVTQPRAPISDLLNGVEVPPLQVQPRPDVAQASHSAGSPRPTAPPTAAPAAATSTTSAPVAAPPLPFAAGLASRIAQTVRAASQAGQAAPSAGFLGPDPALAQGSTTSAGPRQAGPATPQSNALAGPSQSRTPQSLSAVRTGKITAREIKQQAKDREAAARTHNEILRKLIYKNWGVVRDNPDGVLSPVLQPKRWKFSRDVLAELYTLSTKTERKQAENQLAKHFLERRINTPPSEPMPSTVIMADVLAAMKDLNVEPLNASNNPDIGAVILKEVLADRAKPRKPATSPAGSTTASTGKPAAPATPSEKSGTPAPSSKKVSPVRPTPTRIAISQPANLPQPPPQPVRAGPVDPRHDPSQPGSRAASDIDADGSPDPDVDMLSADPLSLAPASSETHSPAIIKKARFSNQQSGGLLKLKLKPKPIEISLAPPPRGRGRPRKEHSVRDELDAFAGSSGTMTPSTAPRVAHAGSPLVPLERKRKPPVNRAYVEILTRPRKRKRTSSSSVEVIGPPRQGIKGVQFEDLDVAPERFDRVSTLPYLNSDMLKRSTSKICRWEGCDARLASEWHLQQHMKRRKHLDGGDATADGHPGLFKCRWQGCHALFFRNEAALSAHIYGIHITAMLSCPFLGCVKTFPNISALQPHVKRRHQHGPMTQLRPMATGIDRVQPDPQVAQLPIPHRIRTIVLSDVVVHPAKWRTERIRLKCLDIVSRFCWSSLGPEDDRPPTPPSIAVPLPEIIPEPALEEIFSPGVQSLMDDVAPISADPLELAPLDKADDENAARWQLRQRAQINYEIKMSRIGIPVRTIKMSRKEMAKRRALVNRADVVIYYKRRKRTRRSPDPEDIVYD